MRVPWRPMLAWHRGQVLLGSSRRPSGTRRPSRSRRPWSVIVAAVGLAAAATTLWTAVGAVPAAAATPSYGPWFKHVGSFSPTPQDQFKPVRLAVSGDGVWVADQEAGRIVRFDLTGGIVDDWTGAGTMGSTLKGPNGLALSNDGGQLFVADTGNHRVVVVSTADWSVLQEIGGTQGPGDGQLDSPNDIDVWAGGIVPPADGELFVADTGNHRVVEYTFNVNSGLWKFARAWGTQGSGTGQFSSPSGVAIDHHRGWVWVADTGNDRIQVLDKGRDEPVAVFGEPGGGAGQFSSPQDLAFIPDPLTLLVADENNHRVQEWSVDTTGDVPVVSYRRSFGAGGSGQGQMQNPQGVAADKDQVGDMYVADTYNHRVQLWRRDTVGPRTYAYSKVTVRHDHTARLTYKVSDSLSDRCTVEIRIYRSGVKKKTLTLGWRAPGSWRTATFTCKLAPGSYTWKVYARDRAGNVQRSPIGTKTLVVTR